MDNDRDILLVAIFTFLTVFAWIFFELAKTTKTSTVTISTQQIIQPLNPKIDTDTLEILSQRQHYR